MQVRTCSAVLQMPVKRAPVTAKPNENARLKKKKRKLIKLIKNKCSFIASHDHTAH